MPRHLSESEKWIVQTMLRDVHPLKITPEELSVVEIEGMDDGGMGSLLFESGKPDRCLGKDLAREVFVDRDGVDVIATLSLDNYGDLFELDIWKVDFSPVVSLRRKDSSTAS